LEQYPFPLQLLGQTTAVFFEQSVPENPVKHTHFPAVLQCPYLLQFLGHALAISLQFSPRNPYLQEQVPVLCTHTPPFKQSLSHFYN